ncbi:hypothetical protein IHE45_10G029600 [Dioscorea alata]|uniref:Uncharacterized protein n=1 Tax=Dioscorea alata TaxID=55571 RepID=A0ACB7VAC6_DIOAL|nr:hypothetical protein IHE45_10G029600 [Dioscorea alata]
MSFNLNVSEKHVSENHNLRILNVADHKPTRISTLIDEKQREISDIEPRATREGICFELEFMVRSFHLPPDRLQVLAIKELHGSAQALQNVLALKLGILKSQRGGCRGPCPCLECTTFLVHAEKAFKFSKKQMHGADDIIVGLMKELSHLRSLVEKSVLKPKYIPLLGFVLHFLALKAEEIAKSLLSQMFNDLNEHCQIPVSSIKEQSESY